MFDGETVVQQCHCAGCIMLLDDTDVVSMLGGLTQSSSPFDCNICLYHWSKSAITGIEENDSLLLACICYIHADPSHPAVLQSCLTPVGAVLCAQTHVTSAGPSSSGHLSEEVIILWW